MAQTLRVVLAGAGGPIGRALAGLLPRATVSSLTSQSCDLTSIPDTEVALAGADVVVFLARSGRPLARLVQASRQDLDVLLADTMARAAPKTSVKRIVLFACGDNDDREAVLAQSGVPVAVLRGGGTEPAAELARLVEAAGVEQRTLAAWTGGDDVRPALAVGSNVCSVQRHALPGGWTAKDAAWKYFEWLHGAVPLVRVERRDGVFQVAAAGLEALLLQHAPGRSTPESCVLEFRGGAFAGQKGRFEFRVLAGGGLLTALIGFEPALPWPVYRLTQAVAHGAVMKRFGAFLAAQPARA